MGDRAAISGGAGAKNKHQKAQGQEEELDVLFLDFGKGSEQTECSGFHGSPSVGWVE